MRELGVGAGYLAQGFRLLRRRPALFVLGMVPALVVFVLLAAAFVTLCFFVGDIVSWATPFADGWADPVRQVLRVLLGLALLAGTLILSSAVFVGLTLVVGDPFYEKIWRETEIMLGGPVPDDGPGFLEAVRDGLVLAGVGILIAVGLFVIGFLPVVGTVVGAVLGVLTAGRLLARELLGRPLGARGLDRHAQLALMRPRRTAVLGFGSAAQLWFLVPFGGVLMMPAAVVGATILARDLLPVPAVPEPPVVKRLDLS